MLQSLNQGAWKSMENTWKTALDAGKKVEVDIKIIYGDPLKLKRPTSFEIDVWLDGVKQNPKIFSN
ncbi:MAG: DNA/RNA non-specific endonuclease [Sediminibacterium sp.]|jgi:filamentous hemagglutinin|nr:DNA/RNA non-specific endonuclease [Sediminibacterium sp.]